MIRLARQLTDFTFKYDPIQNKSADKEKVKHIYKTLLEKNRILFKTDNEGNVIGFLESWRLDDAQLGWVMTHPDEYPDLYNWEIETGHICYVANFLIHPDFRKGSVIRLFKSEFFKQNYMCDFFLGERRAKKHQPFNVYRRQDFYDKYVSREVIASGKE